jgi:small subunit ribosomal protein SAe
MNPLALKEEDLKLMLAAKVHQGTKNVDYNMRRYIWKRRSDEIHIINLGKTWEKLTLAARIIVAIENPEDVIVVSARPFGQRAVFKFAQHTGAQYIGGRYTPGTFTNQIQKKFLEPRLLVVTDPRVDHQPVKEASFVNMPCIAFCDSDSPMDFIDVAIPCNNKAKKSIALMYWLLAREILRLRDVISRNTPWDIMVDLFMYRDPDKVADVVTDEPMADAGVSEVTAETLEPFAAIDSNVATGGKVAEWGAEEESTQQSAGQQDQWGAQAPAQNQEWAAQTPQGWEDNTAATTAAPVNPEY